MKTLILVSLFIFSLQAKVLTVMTYNAHNLFDTLHDQGKNDYTYLPLSFKQQSQEVQDYCASISNEYYRENCLTFDWSEDALDKKLNNLKKVLITLSNGRGADVIALQEVENLNVLTMLQKKLARYGYKYVSLIEGPDSRGIDVGFISKYKINREVLHKIDMTGVAKETRGILEVEIEVNRKKVVLFANHWPSQNNSDEARLLAAKELIKAAKKVEDKSDLMIALGDFNTLVDDSPNAIEEASLYFDLSRDEAKLRDVNVFKGTHWYAGHWSALDKIMVFEKYSKDIQPLYTKYDIFHFNFMLGQLTWTDRDTGDQTVYNNVPIAYDWKTGRGYSDHLPVIMQFEIR